MQYSFDQTSCLKLLNLFGNELLPLQGLLSNLLLDKLGMWADNKVVLDYLPWEHQGYQMVARQTHRYSPAGR